MVLSKELVIMSGKMGKPSKTQPAEGVRQSSGETLNHVKHGLKGNT